MSSPYTGFSSRVTPQSEPIPFQSQVKNNAGGYTYKLDKWGQLERFLILGSEGGTYYVSERALTKDNANSAVACIQADGKRVVDLVVAISDAGRAPKNDPALFVLALAAAAPDVETRQYALSKLGKVARIPTHLFHFVEMVKQHRGWGPTLHKALQRWYAHQDVDRLAYEMVKYQQRDGWSHRDILRKARPKADSADRNVLYKWATKGFAAAADLADQTEALIPAVIRGFEAAKLAEDPTDLADLIVTYNLSREMVPTEALKSPEVWEALLQKMPLGALVRNLGNMSKCGLLKPFSDAEKLIRTRLTDPELIKKSRLHPYAILLASKTYAQGHGVLGKGEWTPNAKVIEALDGAFELSFKALEPTGKRFLIGEDVSGSMSTSMISSGQKDKYGYDIAGPISAAEGGAALALAIARVEPECYIHGFTAGSARITRTYVGHKGYLDGFVDLGINAKTSLVDAIHKAKNLNFGATDCAIPALWALKNKIAVDAIVIITDNETWAGDVHPVQALRDYRNKTGIPVRQVVIGMTATGFTIADPSDPYSLDVVGFDANVPAIIQDFVR